MKQCAQSDETRLIAAMSAQLKGLEKAFSPYRQLVGVDATPAQSIVSVSDITEVPVGVQVKFVITWFSSPGEIFQIQTSPDTTSWTSIASPIYAAEAPATSTSWTSIPVSIGDTPIFWRVRRFPKAFTPC